MTGRRPRLSPAAALLAGAAAAAIVLAVVSLAALNARAVLAYDLLLVGAPPISTVVIQIPTSASTAAPPAPPPTETPPLRAALDPGMTSPATPTPWPLPPSHHPSPESAPTDVAGAREFVVGWSVEGREISGLAFPARLDGPAAQALVLVGGIHGDETNAAPVLSQLAADLGRGALTLPPGLSLYIVPVLNPDGAAAARRFNAAGIDLNRNWDTYDWRPGIEVSTADYLPAAGGPEPLSEPETRAMAEWLLGLRANYAGGVAAIYFHAAFPPEGIVLPGTHLVEGRELADAPSRRLGEAMARAGGYGYANGWPGGYRVTGDASTWAVAHGIRSLAVELPVRGDLDEVEAAKLRRAILAVIDLLGAR